MSGYVGRDYHDKATIAIDLGIQFLKDPYDRNKVMIFETREDAVKHFREKELYADDDIFYLYWFEEGEDRKRNLLTGDLLMKPLPPDWLPEDDILPEEEDDDD